MKNVMLCVLALLGFLHAADVKKVSFEEYLLAFDYAERETMKIKTPEMLALVEEGKAILVDVRFREEFEVWHMNFAKNIPLNELPKRLNELPKDTLIITACPHNDRANLARLFLVQNGYNAKYLNDGLLKVADFLRGDNAKEFLEAYQTSKEKK